MRKTKIVCTLGPASDTKGPEYCIKTFEGGKILLSEGDRFTFTTDELVGNRERVSVSYAKLPEELQTFCMQQ